MDIGIRLSNRKEESPTQAQPDQAKSHFRGNLFGNSLSLRKQTFVIIFLAETVRSSIYNLVRIV